MFHVDAMCSVSSLSMFVMALGEGRCERAAGRSSTFHGRVDDSFAVDCIENKSHALPDVLPRSSKFAHEPESIYDVGE